MTYLDEDVLASVRAITRGKLSVAERVAIYAFAQKGVPIKVIARTFGISPNAVRYITNYETTAAHETISREFERLGEERVWSEIVTQAQIDSINEGNRQLYEGKKLDDSGYRRNARGRPRGRRAGTVARVPETANDGAGGGA